MDSSFSLVWIDIELTPQKRITLDEAHGIPFSFEEIYTWNAEIYNESHTFKAQAQCISSIFKPIQLPENPTL